MASDQSTACAPPLRPRGLVLRQLRADPFVQGFRGVGHLEVAHLEERADFEVALFIVRVRAALHPLDALLEGSRLQDPIARDELLRLGEGAVDDGALAAREADARALRARLEAREVE